MNSDRRSKERGADRRESGRWAASGNLVWRVFRGRRMRESEIVERSLTGLVLRAAAQDVPHVGTRFFPSTADEGARLGMQSAVVRRLKNTADGFRLIFAEIES